MKKVSVLIFGIILSGCTPAAVNDYMFSYYKDYDRSPEDGDTIVEVESTQTQKALWNYADVYLDVYESCSLKSREDGYLGAVHVSSDTDIGLKTTTSLPSGNILYFAFGEYSSEVSCGTNFSATLDPKNEYKFIYSFNPGSGCNVEILSKTPTEESLKPDKTVKFYKDKSFSKSYRKKESRSCES